MPANPTTLQEKNQELRARVESLEDLVEGLRIENKWLQEKLRFLTQRLFGRTSEKLDRHQLELLLGNIEDPSLIESAREIPAPTSPRRRKGRGERKARIPEGTPTEDIVIDPEEVKREPESYERMGEEVTQELDIVPHPYIHRRIIRRKYKSKTDRSQAPIVAPAPPRLIENSIASVGLLVDIILKKYVDHLPLYRQEQTLRARYGIEISRKTMCDWVGSVANWLQPIYHQMRSPLRQSGYLQVDETPVKHSLAEGGGSAQGYLWVYHPPGGDVLYEWHTGRGADCLKGMLEDFVGTIQCDGYAAYSSFTKDREQIELAGCWAHVRRKFFEAKEEAPVLSGWRLHQIAELYRMEAKLRDQTAGPRLRQAVRAAQSGMILSRIEKVLRLKLEQHLPRSRMGLAIAYALSQWKQLEQFRDDGRIEIDNNLVENAIRPTAIGKKNWLFIGHPQAGQRSAILYTRIESCKRRGINPQEYLRDVLARLPTMKITQVAQLTPANWLAARQAKAA